MFFTRIRGKIAGDSEVKANWTNFKLIGILMIFGLNKSYNTHMQGYTLHRKSLIYILRDDLLVTCCWGAPNINCLATIDRIEKDHFGCVSESVPKSADECMNIYPQLQQPLVKPTTINKNTNNLIHNWTNRQIPISSHKIKIIILILLCVPRRKNSPDLREDKERQSSSKWMTFGSLTRRWLGKSYLIYSVFFFNGENRSIFKLAIGDRKSVV